MFHRLQIVFAVLFFVILFHSSFAQRGEIKGRVLEDSTNNKIPLFTINIYKHDSLIKGYTFAIDSSSAASASYGGDYRIEYIKPDTVDVICEAPSHRKAIKKGVLIGANQISFVDFYLKKK